MLISLRPDPHSGECLLLTADGFNGDYAVLSEMISAIGINSAGCLAGGELWRGRTFQAGGRQSGSGGMAAVALGGNVVMGAGAAHGWKPVGAMTRLTRVQGQWVRHLDGQPASETYARLFGIPARDWSRAPLSALARLYPLGVSEDDADGDLLHLYAPLRIEVDGSLRMSAPLPEGKTATLLVGSESGCREAAGLAARRALEALGPTHPRLAVLLVDQAWQDLLETDLDLEAQAVLDVLGHDVPLCGGYTLGQLAQDQPGGDLKLLNQHILVLLFGVKNVEVGPILT
jgi:hypothetical protein